MGPRHTLPCAGFAGLAWLASMTATATVTGAPAARSAPRRATFEAASAHSGRYEPDPATHVRMEHLIAIDPAD